MNKIDFKKQLAHLYKTSAKQIVCIDVPAMNFLMIDEKVTRGTLWNIHRLWKLYTVFLIR